MHDGTVFMYGGIYEEGDKQITLNDFYSLDFHKRDEWSVLIAEDRKLQVWQDSDSSEDEVDKSEESGAVASTKTTRKKEEEDDDEAGMSENVMFTRCDISEDFLLNSPYSFAILILES